MPGATCSRSRSDRSAVQALTTSTARASNWSTVPVGLARASNSACRCGLSWTRTSTTSRFTSRCSGRTAGRANLSAWEQGVSYHKALNEGLFPSARRLAEQIGLDHSNVAKALRVAELPQEIVGAFRSPVDIQFRWAVALDKAYQQDPDAVLSAARLLAGRSPKPAAAEVFRSLTESVSAKGKPKAKEATRTFVICRRQEGRDPSREGWRGHR